MTATVLTLAHGAEFDLDAPAASAVHWRSIAEHLAKENRYNGATLDVTFSVAQHCCHGADAVFIAHGAQAAAYFLLHDAHEALVKDDTTPKKQTLAAIAQREFGVLAGAILSVFDRMTDRIDLAIHTAAGLPWPPPAGMAELVKRYDLMMFATEWRDLMCGRPHPNWGPYSRVEPLRETLRCWDWPHARAEWLRRANALLPALARAPLPVEPRREYNGGDVPPV